MFDVLHLRRLGQRTRRLDLLNGLIRCDAAYRERRRLRDLTAEQLDDVGLTRDDIDRFLGGG